MGYVNRTDLDRHMEALRRYREKASLATIAREMGVDDRTVRNWLTALGEPIRYHGGKQRYEVADGEMRCTECGMLAEAHPSGLCPLCRGEEQEYVDEREAEYELFSNAAFMGNTRNIGRFDRRLLARQRGTLLRVG